jgi:hypothetical protein
MFARDLLNAHRLVYAGAMFCGCPNTPTSSGFIGGRWLHATERPMSHLSTSGGQFDADAELELPFPPCSGVYYSLLYITSYYKRQPACRLTLK